MTDIKSTHRMAGMRVISRAPGSGLHIGTLVDASAAEGHTLKDAQRVWAWEGAMDTSTMASIGITNGTLSPVVDGLTVIPDGRELYQMSRVATEAFESVNVWSR